MCRKSSSLPQTMRTLQDAWRRSKHHGICIGRAMLIYPHHDPSDTYKCLAMLTWKQQIALTCCEEVRLQKFLPLELPFLHPHFQYFEGRVVCSLQCWIIWRGCPFSVGSVDSSFHSSNLLIQLQNLQQPASGLCRSAPKIMRSWSAGGHGWRQCFASEGWVKEISHTPASLPQQTAACDDLR